MSRWDGDFQGFPGGWGGKRRLFIVGLADGSMTLPEAGPAMDLSNRDAGGQRKKKKKLSVSSERGRVFLIPARKR